MKRIVKIIVVVITVFLGLLFIAPVIYRHFHPVAHQLPYKWDAYVQRDLYFKMEPISNVIKAVNAAISEASGGEVPEAIKLDTTPTRITKVNSDPALEKHMDQLIADFRAHEDDLLRKGASGFESAPYTGIIPGNHSLNCIFAKGDGLEGLGWEAKEDAYHVSRMPRDMECRPYYLVDKLFVLMNVQRSENRYKVGAEPIVSALIYETDIHSWSVMLPNGPHSWGSAVRYDKVFKYMSEQKVILALATPDEHVQAEDRLKRSGLWIEPVKKDTKASTETNQTAPTAD